MVLGRLPSNLAIYFWVRGAKKKKESNPNECQASSRCRFSAAFAFPRSSGPAQSWSTELAISWEGHAGGLRFTLIRLLGFGNLFSSRESQKKWSLDASPRIWQSTFGSEGPQKKRVKPKRMPDVFEVPFFRCLCLPSQLRTRTKLVDRASDFFGRACWRSTFYSDTPPRIWQSIFKP